METLRFAQISDLHLYAQKDFVYREHHTYQNFVQVIELLKEDVPNLDCVIFTGDMAANQEKEAYFHIDELMAPLGIRWYWVPGNHDSHTVMQAVRSELSVDSSRYFEEKGVRFIMLNSTDPNEKEVEGILRTSELEFLDGLLADTWLPTIVVLHHQPIAIPNGWVDPLGLRNKQDFLHIIDKHSHVIAVIFGHIHHAKIWEHNQVPYISAPATSYQFNPYTAEFSLEDLAPGYRLYEVTNGVVRSEVKRISF